jgi:type I restriction enzyme S subunit
MKQNIKLLTPKLRFPGFKEGWDAINGDDLFDLIDRRPAPLGLPILAITQERGAVPRDEIDYHVSVSEASIANYKEVHVADFIISLRSFQGGIEYARFHGICSPAYIILRRKGSGYDDFFRHLFKSDRFIQQITRNIEGLRDGKMISYKQFSEQLLPVPAPAEQRKIAACLTSLDELIAGEGRKLEALRKHKKGLMQQLFPREGETRPGLRFPEFRDHPKWEAKRIGELGAFVTSGSRGWAAYYADRGSLFVRITNLSRESIFLNLPSVL